MVKPHPPLAIPE